VVNDVSGLADPDMPAVAARHGAVLVVMHNRASVLRGGVMYPERPYGDVVAEVAAGLGALAARARAAGVPAERLVFDPGLGFGKSPEDNLALLRGLAALPRPLLVGPSRKSFIGHVLGLPVAEREEGTAAAVALSVAGGADIVRVHDVRAMARVARLADAVVRAAPRPAQPAGAERPGPGAGVGSRAE
jgi:dihydropteroate synthase